MSRWFITDKGHIIRAGQLKHELQFQSRTLVRDSGGGGVEAWATVTNGANAWGRVEPMKGYEWWFSGNLEGHIIHRATCRYFEGIDLSDRIVMGYTVNDLEVTGLSDLTIGGDYSYKYSAKYQVVIDGKNVGSPATDTFKWSQDGGKTFSASNVAITGAAQLLSRGVTVTFGAKTGHTLADIWKFEARILNITAALDYDVLNRTVVYVCKEMPMEEL